MKARFAKFFGIGVIVAIAIVAGAIYAQPLLTNSSQSKMIEAKLVTTTVTVNAAKPNCGNPCTVAIKNSDFVVNTSSVSQSQTGKQATPPKEIIFSSGTLSNNSIAIIQVGTTVTWINQESPGTDIIATNSSLWKPVTLLPGESFSFTFNSTGTYYYHSQVNPSSGIIVVISG